MSLPDILFNSPEATVAERGSTISRSSRAELADSLMKAMKEDASGETVERRGNIVSRKRVEGSGNGWTGGLRGINWSSGLSAIGVGATSVASTSTSDPVEPASKSPTIPTPPPLSPFAAEFSALATPPSLADSPEISNVSSTPIIPSTESSPPSLATTTAVAVEPLPTTTPPVEQQEPSPNQFDDVVEISLGRESVVDSPVQLRVIFVRLALANFIRLDD